MGAFLVMKVKDLLKQDLPPTTADAKLRKKHTVGSVTHNLRHDDDHAKRTTEALQELYTVDSKAAKKHAKRVSKQYDKDTHKVKRLMKGWK